MADGGLVLLTSEEDLGTIPLLLLGSRPFQGRDPLLQSQVPRMLLVYQLLVLCRSLLESTSYDLDLALLLVPRLLFLCDACLQLSRRTDEETCRIRCVTVSRQQR